MKPHPLYIILFSITALQPLAAQNLSTEVTVDRNVIPTEREASRPDGLFPEIEIPKTEQIELFPESYTELTSFSRDYLPLNPVTDNSIMVPSPYRGYVTAGYFPTLDFGVSAGYRIINKKDLHLGARLQFGSERYHPYKEAGDNGYQFFADGTVGVDLLWNPHGNSTLKAAAQYNYLREKSAFWNPQHVNSGKIGVKWESSVRNIKYYAEINTHFEKSGESLYCFENLPYNSKIEGVGQQQITFNTGAQLSSGKSGIGFDVSGDFLHTATHVGSTVGFVDLTPAYTYRSRIFSLKAGVKIDFAHKASGLNKVNVMPDISLAYTPAGYFGIWANIGGGSQTNSFASVREECIYQIFTQPFGLTRIPIVVNGGINLGPFRGFYAGVFAGYAKADGILMTYNSFLNPFTPTNINGWHAGIKAGGEWRFIKAEVRGDFAPSNIQSAWYEYHDRASTVVDAKIGVNPYKPLTVSVGYQFRKGRKAYTDAENFLNLGNISDLSAGAEWNFTNRFSVFVCLENILGKKYMLVAGQPSKKLSGLVGVNYKF